MNSSQTSNFLHSSLLRYPECKSLTFLNSAKLQLPKLELHWTPKFWNTINMASSQLQAPLGQVLTDFSINGIYPEEEAVSASYVDRPGLPVALSVLSIAKAELEVSLDSP